MAKTKKQQAAIAMSMKAAGKKPKMKASGSLKEVPSGKKGLAKLPTAVRNKMGYKKDGGITKMGKGGIVKKSLKKYESGNTVSGPGPGDTLSKPRIPAEILDRINSGKIKPSSKGFEDMRSRVKKDIPEFPIGRGTNRPEKPGYEKLPYYPKNKSEYEKLPFYRDTKPMYQPLKKGGIVGKTKMSSKMSKMSKKK